MDVYRAICPISILIIIEIIRKIRKFVKTIAFYLDRKYAIRNRVARSYFGIGDQAET